MKNMLLLASKIIQEIERLSGGKSISRCMFTAVWDYMANQKIRKLIQKVKDKPFQFRDGFTAEKVRSLNREL